MSAYLLPFPSSSHSSSPFERITGLSSYCICGQTLLPHRLHLWVPLPEKLCWLAVYLLLCCGSLSCLQAPFAMWSNLLTFQQRMNMLGILVYCAVSFPFPLDSPSCGCRISCKSEERQKERLKPPWCWRHAPHSNWLVDSGIVSVIIGSSVTMYWGYNSYWEFCRLYIAFDSLTPLHINLCDWPEYAH